MLLAGFNILSLCLISVSLISNLSQNYLKVFLLGFILYRTLHFLDLIISFPALGKFSTTISSNFFLSDFHFLFSLQDSYNSTAVHAILSQRSPRLSSILFLLFPLFCFKLFSNQWEFSLVNSPWGQEFPGSQESCCQCSYDKGLGPNLQPGK